MPNAIARMRKMREMTVRGVAAEMGVASSTVTRMEHKDFKKLSQEKLENIARALGTTVHRLRKMESRHA